LTLQGSPKIRETARMLQYWRSFEGWNFLDSGILDDCRRRSWRFWNLRSSTLATLARLGNFLATSLSLNTTKVSKNLYSHLINKNRLTSELKMTIRHNNSRTKE